MRCQRALEKYDGLSQHCAGQWCRDLLTTASDNINVGSGGVAAESNTIPRGTANAPLPTSPGLIKRQSAGAGGPDKQSGKGRHTGFLLSLKEDYNIEIGMGESPGNSEAGSPSGTGLFPPNTRNDHKIAAIEENFMGAF